MNQDGRLPKSAHVTLTSARNRIKAPKTCQQNAILRKLGRF